MLLFIFFFLNFFTTADFESVEQRPEFVNVYNSGIYSTYLNQRDAYLATQEAAIQKMASEKSPFIELHHLLTLKGERGAPYQAKFMLTLREAIEKKNEASPEVQNFINDYTVWLFGAAHLEAPIHRFLEKALPIDFKETFEKDRKNAFMDIHEVVTTIPEFIEDKKTGRDLPPEDNFVFGDLPSHLFHIGHTEVIRTSNTARDLSVDKKGKTSSAAMNPEFYNYIETLASRGEKHFYVNILSHLNYEYYKAALIEGLEDDPKTASGIIVVSFDKEKTSPFYYQSAPYDTQDDATQFKHNFLERLTHPNGPYYWSKHLDQKEWPKTLSRLIDEVHAEFYHNAPTLDRESRQDFIDFTYVKIIEEISEQFKPKRLNVTCKQAVDRGPTLYGLLYLSQQSKHGPLTQHALLKAADMVFGPALAYQNRATHVYRINRFQSTANRFP